MPYNAEDISLKLLRMLYKFHEENPTIGLEEKLLENKFEFIDHLRGRERVQFCLESLIKLELVKREKIKDKVLYSITDSGIQHYEKFKYLKENTDSSNAVIVEGNWTGNLDHYHIHYHYDQKNVDQFPGETEEFIRHYSELLDEIEATEQLVMDDPPEDSKILERLGHMKTIINLDSLSLGGRLKWESRLEKLIDRLEEARMENISN